MTKILITGGAGYVGSILVHKLFQAESRYITLNRYANKGLGLPISELDSDAHVIKFDKLVVYDNLLYKQVCLTDFCYRPEFEFVHGDVRDWKTLNKYVQEADVIIPLAAIVGFPACEKNPELASAINYEQVKNIVDHTSRDQKIIYPNTNSSYGYVKDGVCTEETPLNPLSVYGRTKVDAEKAVMDKNAGIVPRLATVFGVSPRMRLDLLVNDFTYKAVDDGYIVLFEKDFMRNHIHVQDVAMTFIYLINNYDQYKGNVFNVGSPTANLSKYDLCMKIKKYIPNFSIQCDEINTDMDKRNYVVSNEKLEKTGWKSYYSLDDGIQELIKAYSIIQHNNRKFTNL